MQPLDNHSSNYHLPLTLSYSHLAGTILEQLPENTSYEIARSVDTFKNAFCAFFRDPDAKGVIFYSFIRWIENNNISIEKLGLKEDFFLRKVLPKLKHVNLLTANSHLSTITLQSILSTHSLAVNAHNLSYEKIIKLMPQITTLDLRNSDMHYSQVIEIGNIVIKSANKRFSLCSKTIDRLKINYETLLSFAKRLHGLELRKCTFSEEEIDTLIKRCSNLETLHIESDAVKNITYLAPSLKTLSLICENLESLPKLMPRLTTLCCYKCRKLIFSLESTPSKEGIHLNF